MRSRGKTLQTQMYETVAHPRDICDLRFCACSHFSFPILQQRTESFGLIHRDWLIRLIARIQAVA